MLFPPLLIVTSIQYPNADFGFLHEHVIFVDFLHIALSRRDSTFDVIVIDLFSIFDWLKEIPGF